MEQMRQGRGYIYIKNVGPSPISMNLKRRIDLIPLGSLLGGGVSIHPNQIPFIIDSNGPGEEIVIRPGETLTLRDDELTTGKDMSGIRRLVESGLVEVVDPRTIGPGSFETSPDFVPNMAAYAKLQGRAWWKGYYGSHPEWFEWMTDEQKADAKIPSLAPVEELFVRCPHCDKAIPKTVMSGVIEPMVSEKKGPKEAFYERTVRQSMGDPSPAPLPRAIQAAYRKDFVPRPTPDPEMENYGWMGDKLVDGLIDRLPGVVEKVQARKAEIERERQTRRCGHADGGYLDNYESPRPTTSAPPSQTISISKERLSEVVAEVLKQVFDRLT